MVSRHAKLDASNPFAKVPSLTELTTSMLEPTAQEIVREVERIIEVPSRIQKDGSVQIGNIILTRVGLQFAGDVSAEEYDLFGMYLGSLSKTLTWVIGDYVANCNVYGRTVEQLAPVLRKSEGTIYNWSSLCQRVNFSQRRENLDPSHHLIVASLSPDEQDYWLEVAEKRKWSTRVLATMIEAYPQGLPDETVQVPKPPKRTIVERDRTMLERKIARVPSKLRSDYVRMLREMLEQLERSQD